MGIDARDIVVRDVCEADITSIMGYWLNSDNKVYRQSWLDIDNSVVQAEIRKIPGVLRQQISISEIDRQSTSVILSVDGVSLGHAHLNFIQNDAERRIHFHPWRGMIRLSSLGCGFSNVREMAKAVTRHFFNTYPIADIVGDVSLNNHVMNAVMKRSGYRPKNIVRAVYWGKEDLYNRYCILKP
jgi:hypothetical protein